MIILRCKNCRARVQVPSPGIYRCHNCKEVIEVKAEDYPEPAVSSFNSETVPLEERKADRKTVEKEAAMPEDLIAAFCLRHPGRKAVKTCRNCGDLLCDYCSIQLDNYFYCPDCLQKIQQKIAAIKETGEEKYIPAGQSSIPLENAKGDYIIPFFETLKKVLFNYKEFFNRTGAHTYSSIALLFAIAMNFIYDLVRFVAFNFFGFSLGEPPENLTPLFKDIYKSFTAPSLKNLILSPLTSLIGILILTGIYHLAVLIVKGEGKYIVTLKITSYSLAALAFNTVFFWQPLIGSLATFIFSIIIVMQGSIKLHNLSEGKSIFVALFPTVLVILLLIVAIIAFCSQPVSLISR